MPGLLKLGIGILLDSVMDVPACRQTRCGNGFDKLAHCRTLGIQPSAKAVHGAVHPVPRKRVDIAGLGVVEKPGDVGRGDRVPAQTRLDALETEGRQHQQPRNQRNEQPRHKAEVNTAKVSAGSRIVVGKN